MPFNDRLLRALRREPVDRTPVWFMRQAGRALPRYRELRADHAFFDLLKNPEFAAQVTALPLEYFPVDAAVLYNDLVTPFFGAGFQIELVKGDDDTAPIVMAITVETSGGAQPGAAAAEAAGAAEKSQPAAAPASSP